MFHAVVLAIYLYVSARLLLPLKWPAGRKWALARGGSDRGSPTSGGRCKASRRTRR